MLVLESLRSTHAISDPTNGQICIYFKTDAEMAEAVAWIKKKKNENIPAHIARGCDYPVCYRARVAPTIPMAPGMVATMSTTTVTGMAARGRYVLVFTKDTQHIISMNDEDHGRKMMAHLDVTYSKTDAETGKVQMEFADQAHLDGAVAWARALKIEEFPKHIERGCTYYFCERTRLAAEAQTLVEVKEAEAAAARLKGAAKKKANIQVTILKSRRVSIKAMSFSMNLAMEKEEAAERAFAAIVEEKSDDKSAAVEEDVGEEAITSRTSIESEMGHYVLVFSNDTQHIISMKDEDHGQEMMAHLDVAHVETDAETGNVHMSFTDEAHLDAAETWAKARKIEELPKHVERECTHAFCEHTRLAAEAQTRVELDKAVAIAAGRTGAAKKNATKKVNHLKSRRVSIKAMASEVNRAVENEEAAERAMAAIVEEARCCPKGHALSLHTAVGDKGTCDVCSRRIMHGTTVMDCTPCDFFLCNQCDPNAVVEEIATTSTTVTTQEPKGVAATGPEGGTPAHWASDSGKVCMLCSDSFTLFRRKHHCRMCGFLVCDKCSPHRSAIPTMGYVKAVRICHSCALPSETKEGGGDDAPPATTVTDATGDKAAASADAGSGGGS